jgi:hypothetical protein
LVVYNSKRKGREIKEIPKIEKIRFSQKTKLGFSSNLGFDNSNIKIFYS